MSSTQYSYERVPQDEEDDQSIVDNQAKVNGEHRVDLYLDEQPTTHRKNFPSFLKLFLACWSDRKNDLSRGQI